MKTAERLALGKAYDLVLVLRLNEMKLIGSN